MKILIVLSILFILVFPLAAGEGITDVKLVNTDICVPWSCRGGVYYDDGADNEADSQYLRGLVQEGVFELLREDLYPQMEALLEVSDEQHIRLAIKKAEMIDSIVYCNLCRIYAELLKTKKEASYVQQLGEAHKNIFMNRLKATMNSTLRAPLLPVSEADEVHDTEPPPFVAIRDLQNRVVLLFVADKWQTDSHGRRELFYRLFCVPLLLMPWEDEREQYQVFKELKLVLSFPQFIFEQRLLKPLGRVLAASPYGCEYITIDYSLEDIRKQERKIADTQPKP